MKEKNADICYVGGFIPFNIAFMKQAKELNYNPKEFHITHSGISFKEALGKDAEYVTGSSFYVKGIKMGSYKFFEELLKRINVLSVQEYPWIDTRYWALETIQWGIETSQSLKPDDLMKGFKELHIMCVTGPLHFDETGKGTNLPTVTQIINGQYQFAWPIGPNYPPSKHIYPRPNGSDMK
jgi:ABC-type branched-subunit amino acid transport system substrate-binding protein